VNGKISLSHSKLIHINVDEIDTYLALKFVVLEILKNEKKDFKIKKKSYK